MGIEGIAAGVTAQSQALTQATISTSVLRKALDIQENQGAMLVQMMAAQNGLGTNVNSVA